MSAQPVETVLRDRVRQVLVDPLLREGPALMRVLGLHGPGVAPFGPAVLAPADRAALLDEAGPGTLVVLADPHPAVVAVLVRWDVLVVGVNTTGARSREWRNEVLGEGALAALVQPRTDRLADVLAVLVAGVSTG